jgi:peptidyl-prolyl cis-trans isomerase SurA
MKNYLILIFLCLFFNNVQSIETKIIYSIQNEIITNIDIKNEFKYLVALNNNLKELDKEIILNISKNSIISKKIKKIELLKNFNEVKIDEEYLNYLLKNIYSKLGLKTSDEFELYLNNYDLSLSYVKEKLTIDALWNELIILKYKNQIVIDEVKIKKEISDNSNIQSKEYQLSEISFEIKDKTEIKIKYDEIIKSINDIGFENTASIYSFSSSSTMGGDIGWINKNSLSNKIYKNINDLKIGEISKPITLPNGILILKITDIKFSKINIDMVSTLKKAINYERDRQLNQYSKIYYNKIKKNLKFDD